MNYERPNEERADVGEEAVRIGSFDFPDDVYTAVGDAICNILHFCDRFGIDHDEVWDRAVYHVKGDEEDGPPTKCVGTPDDLTPWSSDSA